MQKRNLIYFVCHDLGRGLGAYGAQLPTPRLDAFADGALRFNNAHCASPACSPSRACAMTGLYAHTSGAIGLSHMGWPLAMKHKTSVDDFNAAGYQTILSGVNHERHPRTDRYQVDVTHIWEDWSAERAVGNALTALENRDLSRPFYLNVGVQQPHSSTWKNVGRQIPPLPLDWPEWLPPGMPETPALRAAFRQFAAAVRHMDTAFGCLLDGLDRLGLTSNTIIVFTTDHGMAGPRGKGSLYGLGTEIALLMRVPGGPTGTRDQLISNVDYRSTWCDAVGLPIPEECQGKSFWPCVENANHAHHDALFIERNYHGEKPWRKEPDFIDCYDPMRAVRTRDHLYIRNFEPGNHPAEPTSPCESVPGLSKWEDGLVSWKLPQYPRPAEELYDLRTDPQESLNVVGEPAQDNTLTTLRQRLASWMQSTGDFPPGPPPPRPEAPGWGPNWPGV